MHIDDDKCLVFADEKPFHGKDIFDHVRRNPFSGEVLWTRIIG